VEVTLRVIGGRWKVLVLRELLDGTRRFGVLLKALPSISHRTLIRQLRELEADDVISRKQYPEVPPRVEYALTPLGASLRPVLLSMHDWGVKHASRVKPSRASA
jgi:DNA-binding HxlR family transcriptional regulator